MLANSSATTDLGTKRIKRIKVMSTENLRGRDFVSEAALLSLDSHYFLQNYLALSRRGDSSASFKLSFFSLFDCFGKRFHLKIEGSNPNLLEKGK